MANATSQDIWLCSQRHSRLRLFFNVHEAHSNSTGRFFSYTFHAIFLYFFHTLTHIHPHRHTYLQSSSFLAVVNHNLHPHQLRILIRATSKIYNIHICIYIFIEWDTCKHTLASELFILRSHRHTH